MARAAVLGRLTWRVGTVVGVSDETATARTLGFSVPDWPGHRAGQHVDVRLTAPDGYSTQRSYSIGSAAGDGPVELTIQRVPGGEVSTYLCDVLAPGDQLELRGPVGGWFVWEPGTVSTVHLFAGGSGIVPLMSMIRTHRDAGDLASIHLWYSLRTPRDAIYASELAGITSGGTAFGLHWIHTRAAPPDDPRPPGRLMARDIGPIAGPGDGADRRAYVCGPTGFVEATATLLTGLGYDPSDIRTERFG